MRVPHEVLGYKEPLISDEMRARVLNAVGHQNMEFRLAQELLAVMGDELRYLRDAIERDHAGDLRNAVSALRMHPRARPKIDSVTCALPRNSSPAARSAWVGTRLRPMRRKSPRNSVQIASRQSHLKKMN